MTEAWTPTRWANSISTILRLSLGDDRLPVRVADVALEFTRHRYPDDPISRVEGASLPRFDGTLHRDPKGKKGWAIFYNSDVTSAGRKNFTLAHEFGHYLLHRSRYPDGFDCGQQDIVRWDSGYKHIERDANEFAATLLMPLDDYRTQLPPDVKPTFDDLSGCADRYEVSLVAATLRWLAYTQRRSVLVVSREGYILWARSSSAALRTGAYFKTAARPPIPVPATSLVSRAESPLSSEQSVTHDAGVWFSDSCTEICLNSDRYDFTLSLLHMDAAQSPHEQSEDTDP